MAFSERWPAVKARYAFACATAAAIVLLVAAPILGQQEVRLRVGDSIRLDVPEREDLGRLLNVDAKGEVSLPIVGPVRVEGLTLEETRTALLRSLQEVYPSVQTISVSLIGEESRRLIYVQGQVARPGKYEIGGTPTVWDAIKEAGGATLTGSLSAVRIIRASGEGGTSETFNLQEALDSGNLGGIPTLRPGDTIIVPERTASYTGSGAVNVFGAVLHPAAYVLSGDKRLTDAILVAGGPIDGAKLGKVAIIRPGEGGTARKISVNFGRFLDHGDMRQNPPIYPNDTVNVPKGGTFWSTVFSPDFMLALVTTSATVAALVIYSRE